jgi:hypothetical protein
LAAVLLEIVHPWIVPSQPASPAPRDAVLLVIVSFSSRPSQSLIPPPLPDAAAQDVTVTAEIVACVPLPAIPPPLAVLDAPCWSTSDWTVAAAGSVPANVITVPLFPPSTIVEATAPES